MTSKREAKAIVLLFEKKPLLCRREAEKSVFKEGLDICNSKYQKGKTSGSCIQTWSE